MSGDPSSGERTMEASPARVARAIEEGHGPRAPWLASSLGGLLALGILAVAAGPLAAAALGWLRAALTADVRQAAAMDWAGVLWPTLVGPLVASVAVAGGHALAHAGWVRLGPWKRARRPGIAVRLRAVVGGWTMAAAALAGGVAAGLPWLPFVPGLVARPWPGSLWALGSFAVSVALGALLATGACGLAQRRLSRLAFERSMRMTPSEAREAARQEGSVRRPAPRSSRWRLP